MFVIVAVAVTGTLLTGTDAAAHRGVPASASILVAYLPFVVVQWGTVLYVARVGRPTWALGALVGERAKRIRDAMIDIALAIGAAVTILTIELACTRLLGMGARRDAFDGAFLPRSGAERAAWIVVALTAGFCEEVVYRGYLQTQLWFFTRSASAGVVLQALLFGVAHAEQGAMAASRVVLYGLVLGALARWRRSLVPGMLCHAGIDLARIAACVGDVC